MWCKLGKYCPAESPLELKDVLVSFETDPLSVPRAPWIARPPEASLLHLLLSQTQAWCSVELGGVLDNSDWPGHPVSLDPALPAWPSHPCEVTWTWASASLLRAWSPLPGVCGQGTAASCDPGMPPVGDITAGDTVACVHRCVRVSSRL
jgi:hypothetical protein